MPDGTIFAGVDPDTGASIYAMPCDLPATRRFREAAGTIALLNEFKAHGHDDWQIPTASQLGVLFKNRAAIGGFNTSGRGPASTYGSSSGPWPWHDLNHRVRFSDGRDDVGPSTARSAM